MALVEAARFHTLSEAQVAASVLHSAGIPASIADAHFGSVFWLHQNALGGYRLSVPEEDVADAAAMLDVPIPAPLDDEPEELLSPGRRVAAGALALWPEAGWLVTRRLGPTLTEVGTGWVLAAVALAVVGGTAFFVISFLFKLLFAPP